MRTCCCCPIAVHAELRTRSSRRRNEQTCWHVAAVSLASQSPHVAECKGGACALRLPACNARPNVMSLIASLPPPPLSVPNFPILPISHVGVHVLSGSRPSPLLEADHIRRVGGDVLGHDGGTAIESTNECHRVGARKYNVDFICWCTTRQRMILNTPSSWQKRTLPRLSATAQWAHHRRCLCCRGKPGS